MRYLATALAGLGLLAATPHEGPPSRSFFDLTVQGLDGSPLPLSAFKGRVVLAVNVASACGFTPQYAGLEWLYETYKERGLVVVGFPCNQFGGQEPGDGAAIQSFCSSKFHVTFPMSAKLEVKGSNQAEVYAFLTQGREVPAWNFHKYLIGRDGQVIRTFPSATAPESEPVKQAIEAALAL